MIQDDSKLRVFPAAPTAPLNARSDWLTWPRSGGILGTFLLACYAPTLLMAGQTWFHNENYSHGVLIFPIVFALLWLERKEIALARSRPFAWGLLLLGVGLLLQTAATVLQVRYIGMWSLIPTLWGVVLALHGVALWRLVRFPIGMIFFAGPIPNVLLNAVSLWVRNASTDGAANLMNWLGFMLVQNGNLLQIPGAAIEVADVCSGFNKLLALVTFAALYGYLFTIPVWKRIALVLCALPIALLANVTRIAFLIAVATKGGLPALHRAHDFAEIGVLLVSFALFVGVGKVLGCKTVRFSL